MARACTSHVVRVAEMSNLPRLVLQPCWGMHIAKLRFANPPTTSRFDQRAAARSGGAGKTPNCTGKAANEICAG